MKIILALALLSVATLASGAGSFNRQGAADPRGRVEISNLDGAVDITTWDRPEFSVEAQFGDNVDRVDVESQPGVTSIRVTPKRQSSRNGGAKLQIRVPAGSRIEATGVSASISLRGAFDRAELRTVSGNVVVEGRGEQLEVRTVSGRAEVTGTGAATRARVESVSGAVVVRQMAGDLEAQATSGKVTVSMPGAQRLRVRTVSGSADIEATLAPQAVIEAEVFSGALDARLNAPQGLRFDLSTFSGAVRNCLAEGQKTGSTGAGNGNVRLRSFSGSISFCDK